MRWWCSNGAAASPWKLRTHQVDDAPIPIIAAAVFFRDFPDEEHVDVSPIDGGSVWSYTRKELHLGVDFGR